jgi:hypothetical protein
VLMAAGTAGLIAALRPRQAEESDIS